ncbi:MAG: ATP-binding cassette domain-containing protein, partial [Spirochaetota bacterium]|nr:ATP-binding cassette domain-containing protein [Spirochaetota bacterium]
MARIELVGLGHQYTVKNRKKDKKKIEEKIFRIEDLYLEWENGSANALLGPSGCGKTTLLNIISGLLIPQEGKVLFDGKDVTKLSPRQRHISQVFQFPVVYESLSVYGNIAYPLKNDRVAPSEIRRRVHEIAELLELTDSLNKST